MFDLCQRRSHRRRSRSLRAGTGGIPRRAADAGGDLPLLPKRREFRLRDHLERQGLCRAPGWRAEGYIVKLFFLRLASPDLAIARVRQRVREGGHNIPEPVIRRRFASGLSNFENLYKPLVDEWALYDNSGSEPVLIKEGVNT